MGTIIPEPGWRVWADSAYSSEEKIKAITEKGFMTRMISKQYKRLPTWSAGARQNTRRSKIRVRVEHVFGFMTNSMKHTGVRTIGLLRAKARLGLDNLVYN
ncbi:MAG: transposase, partial [Gammaproteobacteria bacterium]|nr:transposase [Gammaproteobacteria bacterium]